MTVWGEWMLICGAVGFHASTEAEYAEGFTKALMMGDEETKAMRRRARVSSRRFTEKAFAERWVVQLERLIKLQRDVKN